MKKLPKIAIVGRPNVGKSALFNRILKKRLAIVDEAEGITRDRLYAEAECFGRPFEVIDTGGIDSRSKTDFNDQVKWQAEIAIEEADGLIMVVDSQVGITDLDKEVARILLRTQKPLVLAVNKVDNENQESLVHEFYSLGIEKMVPTSAAQGLHIAEVLEAVVHDLPEMEEIVEEEERTRIAIIGRANVGKSTLINQILDEKRCIVSPIAGTTRDAIDVHVRRGNEEFTFIDTAGIRRKTAEHEVVDKFAAIRTQRTIARADICLLIVDAQEGITSQEKRIARMIEEEGKACILLFNKWDLVKGVRMEHCLKNIHDENHFLRHCPMLCLSAMSGRNVDKIFEIIAQVQEEMQKRISTGQLNNFIERCVQMNHPPMLGGRRLRIYYLTQVGVTPPRFVLFINHEDLVASFYKKYLINQLRKEFKFSGLPIVFHLKGKPTRKEQASRKKRAHAEAFESAGFFS